MLQNSIHYYKALIMKKILLVIIAALTFFSVQASAQIKWGATVGINFNTKDFAAIDMKARAGWNIGATALIDLPLGFSVQPSLVYSQKGANLADGVSFDMGYLQLPVSVQWGPDLLLFRPFLDVTPFVGCAISNVTKMNIASLSTVVKNEWEGLNKLEYGLGIGAGVNVWKLQLVARYNWNLGSLYDLKGWDDVLSNVTGLKKENANFGGITINVSYFF